MGQASFFNCSARFAVPDAENKEEIQEAAGGRSTDIDNCNWG